MHAFAHAFVSMFPRALDPSGSVSCYDRSDVRWQGGSALFRERQVDIDKRQGNSISGLPKCLDQKFNQLSIVQEIGNKVVFLVSFRQSRGVGTNSKFEMRITVKN